MNKGGEELGSTGVLLMYDVERKCMKEELETSVLEGLSECFETRDTRRWSTFCVVEGYDTLR